MDKQLGEQLGQQLGMTTGVTGNKLSLRLLEQRMKQAARDATMEDADEPTSQRQSRRKGKQPSRVVRETKGTIKKRRSKSEPAIPSPTYKGPYREPVVHFNDEAEVKKFERLAPGSLSGRKLSEWRKRYEMMRTQREIELRQQREADALEAIKTLHSYFDEATGVEQNTAAATRSADATKDLDYLFEGLNLKKAEGRRRRRRRTRRRNPNKNNHKNTNKQLPFVRRFRLRY